MRHNGGNKAVYKTCKRAFDIIFSAGIIIVGFVPGLILSGVIAKNTGGSPIYTQARVGMGGLRFKILKFRTMVVDADNVEKYLNVDQLRQWHEERKVEDDPRITSLGHALRRTSIDELPQFINVLAGQMSIIGPRAITEGELAWYSDEDRETLLSVPAGITGLWQTGPRNEYTFESGKRQELELSYVQNASMKLDVILFFKTFKTIVMGTGK